MKLCLPDYNRIISRFKEEKQKGNVVKVGIDENVRYKYISKKIIQNEFQINRKKNNFKKIKINNILDQSDETETQPSHDFLDNLKNTENSFEVIPVETRDVNRFLNNQPTSKSTIKRHINFQKPINILLSINQSNK